MSKNTTETALATIEHAYPALAGGGEMATILEQNMGGEELTMFDLERIRVPSGGGIAWEVTGDDGEPEVVRSLEGIVVFTKIGRSYWSEGLDAGGGGTPPDCSSPDGVRGIGSPGGLCRDCALSQWGSDDPSGEGRGQACTQRRYMFILREGCALPAVVSVPPTSLKAIKRWLFQLASRSRPYWSVVAKFELVKTKNKGGIEYAQIKATTVRALTPSEIATVQAYAQKTADTFREYSEGAEEPAA